MTGPDREVAAQSDLLGTLPSRRGHFLLESGYHTDLWLDLDGFFVQPGEAAPLVAELAERIARYRPTAVCGPLIGGALLAHAVATSLAVNFYFAEPVPHPSSGGLFTAVYRLPAAHGPRIRGERVALVDDAISAGSSVRATATAVIRAGGSLVAVGTLLALGRTGLESFAARGVPVEALGYRDFPLWEPPACPLCRIGSPLEDPRG